MFGQRSPLVGHTVNTAVGLVAVWVADVVLHVADNHILPVGNIESAVATNLEVGRSQVAIVRDKQVVRLGAPDIPFVIVSKSVLLDSEETDSITNQEVTVVFFREMVT